MNIVKYIALGILAALALAFAAVLSYTLVKQPAPTPPPARVAPTAAEPGSARLQHMLAQQSNEIRRLKKEKTALLDELGQQVNELAKPTPPPARATGPAGTPRPAGMSKMVAVAIRQQADMKLATLKSRLHLTDEQAAAIGDLLKKQTDQQVEMATKMFEGNLTAEDMKLSPKSDFEGQLKQVLSTDQLAGYQQYKTDEQQQQVRMASQGELMQISPMLQLSAQQQEQVGSVLQQQYQQIIAKQSDAGSSSLGGLQVMDQMLDAKKEALRSVLTPDQMQSYEKFIESQREMIKSMIPQSQTTSSP
jgi:hypothetical protein